MNIKNLERAAEISRQLPALEEARRLLSGDGAYVIIIKDGKEELPLPKSFKFNVLSQLNADINRMKEEVKGL